MSRRNWGSPTPRSETGWTWPSKTLGYQVEKDESEYNDEKKQRQEILAALERGEISPPEAAKQLKRIGK